MFTTFRTSLDSDSDDSTIMPDLPTWTTLRDNDEDDDVDMDAGAKAGQRSEDVDMDANGKAEARGREEEPLFRPPTPEDTAEPLFRPDTPPPVAKPPPSTVSTPAPSTGKRRRTSTSPLAQPYKRPRKELVLQNIWDANYIANNLRALDAKLVNRGLPPITPQIRAAVSGDNLHTSATPATTTRPISRVQPADEGFDLAIQNDFARQLFGKNADEAGYQYDQPQKTSSPSGSKGNKGKGKTTPIKPALRIRDGTSTTPEGHHRVGQLPQLPRQVRFASESPEKPASTSSSNATAEASSSTAVAIVPKAASSLNVRSDSLEKAAQKINALVKGKTVPTDQALERVSRLLAWIDDYSQAFGSQQLQESGLGAAVTGLSQLEKGDIPYGDEHKLLKRAQRLIRLWMNK
ncbi:hypothetical protein CALVIDRAFT_114273 [Calocera viscosa TUFC12733]|uniref:Uncharacterized protein n=1 Tax=Calocera viscosa (strain TUFC12733) TaxID=1330018 RepID=A0A167M5X5_CALVF|nr:hypothetical protein CALVIDRAFT_114273 [Calocera viscosa TUFC12733]